MLKPTKVTLQAGSLRLAGLFYLPKSASATKPVPGIIVAHGLGSKKENHAAFAEYAAEQGLAALAFDWRGHGESAGNLDDKTVDDIGAALAYLERRPEVDEARLAIRATSMGAYFALHAAAVDARLKAVVAIAPATEEVVLMGVAPVKAGKDAINFAQGARVQRKPLTAWLQSHDVAQAVAKIAPRAVFFVHCKGDEIIPYQSSERLYAAAGEPKKLLLLQGGHHRFAQQDGAIHRLTVEWLKKRLSRYP